MIDQADPFTLPTVPNAAPNVNSDLLKTPDYGNMMDLIKLSGSGPNLTHSALPSIASLLAPGGQYTNPYETAIRESTAHDVAETQTDMMKRGLTGSDIEASAMGLARAKGGQSLASLYSGTASTLSQQIMQAVSGDISTNRETLISLAQAMGQKITSDQDLKMFQQQLQASLDMASQQARAQQNAAIMGMVGSVAGAATSVAGAKMMK